MIIRHLSITFVSLCALYVLSYVIMAWLSGYTPLHIYSKMGDHHSQYTPAWLCGSHKPNSPKVWPSATTVPVKPLYYCYYPLVVVDRMWFHPDASAAPPTRPPPIKGKVAQIIDSASIFIQINEESVAPNTEFVVYRGNQYICKARVVAIEDRWLRCEIILESMNTRGHTVATGDLAQTRLF